MLRQSFSLNACELLMVNSGLFLCAACINHLKFFVKRVKNDLGRRLELEFVSICRRSEVGC